MLVENDEKELMKEIENGNKAVNVLSNFSI